MTTLSWSFILFSESKCPNWEALLRVIGFAGHMNSRESECLVVRVVEYIGVSDTFLELWEAKNTCKKRGPIAFRTDLIDGLQARKLGRSVKLTAQTVEVFKNTEWMQHFDLVTQVCVNLVLNKLGEKMNPLPQKKEVEFQNMFTPAAKPVENPKTVLKVRFKRRCTEGLLDNQLAQSTTFEPRAKIHCLEEMYNFKFPAEVKNQLGRSFHNTTFDNSRMQIFLNAIDRDTLDVSQKAQLDVILTGLGTPTVDPLLVQNNKLLSDIATLTEKLKKAQTKIAELVKTKGSPVAFSIGDSVAQFVEAALKELESVNLHIEEFYGEGTKLKEFLENISYKHLGKALDTGDIDDIAKKMKNIACKIRPFPSVKDTVSKDDAENTDSSESASDGEEPKFGGGSEEPRTEVDPVGEFWDKVDKGEREDKDSFESMVLAVLMDSVQNMSMNIDYTGYNTKLEKVFSLYTKPGENTQTENLLKQINEHSILCANLDNKNDLHNCCIAGILFLNYYWTKNNLLGIDENNLSCSREKNPMFNQIKSEQTLMLIFYFCNLVFASNSTYVDPRGLDSWISSICEDYETCNIIELICFVGKFFQGEEWEQADVEEKLLDFDTEEKKTEFLKMFFESQEQRAEMFLQILEKKNALNLVASAVYPSCVRYDPPSAYDTAARSTLLPQKTWTYREPLHAQFHYSHGYMY